MDLSQMQPDPSVTMEDEHISKTRRKKEARALRGIGEQLVALSPEQLKNIDMPEELQEAVVFAREITSHGARRRQIQYIGALMRDIETDSIESALENIRHGDARKAHAFKKIETWRDRIKQGDTAILEDILRTCPDAERQRLTQLARNAIKEHEKGISVKSSRLLFRYLKQISG
jgi:ribosome-associated protein